MSWKERFALFAPPVVLVWIGLALFAYGLGLKDYASKRRGRDGVFVGELKGRISKVEKSWSEFPGVEFSIMDRNEVFRFPKRFIPDGKTQGLIDQYLRPGATIWFKYLDRDMTVLELRANPDTPYVVQILFWEPSAKTYDELPSSLRAAGSRAVVFGWVLIVVSILVSGFGLRRVLRYRSLARRRPVSSS